MEITEIPERVGWKATKLHTLRMYSPRSQLLGIARNLIKMYLPNMQEAPLHPVFGGFSTKLEVVREGLTSTEVDLRRGNHAPLLHISC